jgi:hypothetical protein
VLLACPTAATTEVEDVDGGPIDGGPLGCYWYVRQRPPPKLETSMADPLEVLPAYPTLDTTEVKDVDGAPLGGAAGMFDNGHHRS